MSKNKQKKFAGKLPKVNFFSKLPQEIRHMIFGVLMILAAVIAGLAFFGKAGKAGELFLQSSRFLLGETTFLIPLILASGGLSFLLAKRGISFFKEKTASSPIILAVLLLIIGIAGMLGSFDSATKKGGWIGYIISFPLLKYFGFWASQIIFIALAFIGILIFWQILKPFSKKEKPVFEEEENIEPGEKEDLAKPSFIKKMFFQKPNFKIKEVSPVKEEKASEKQIAFPKLEAKAISGSGNFAYQPPPLDLLDAEKGVPTSGDTRVNSAIIKRTLQNFGIDVVMSEINIGPTVTQYTLKPAEGVKVSKITTLSNDLALSLASHPIRIEAPIPGRSLVGIEIPNKVRAQVRLRNLLELPEFQKSPANLVLALGRDVAGRPVYADLTKMPHLLVAGSTGTGKTIFLNSLMASLLYQPTTITKSASPQHLRLIMIDPKRVEFPVYENLPHLLCPVIYNAAQTITALKWLIGEMERRFDVLAAVKARDIASFNERALKEKEDPLPFIVLVVDELADLMMARGRDIEGLIVRLAQMARAVGIHLVLATQRPSVEVITGLIKANITSRVTFQVASQIDSRTILDTSGAEKLLGAGDMLFISADLGKPKRIQGAYASDKEVKRVVKYIVPDGEEENAIADMDQNLVQELEKNTASDNGEISNADPYLSGSDFGEEDALYQEARRVVLEAKKASASLLQRRLRIGYARAARLIDVLEEKGVVSHAEGAKPREIIGGGSIEDMEARVGAPSLASDMDTEDAEPAENLEEDDRGDWKKI